MAHEVGGKNRSSGAPAAEATLAILQALGRRGAPTSAAAIARELDLPRSTTYRLLGILRDAGFVMHDDATRRWGLGVAAYELGSAYQRQQPLQRVARAAVAGLADEVGAVAHLAVLHGTDVLYVLEERPLGLPPLVTDVGVRLPAPVTASGLAILAALPRSQVRALFPDAASFVERRPGAGAPTTPGALRSELTRVHQRGHSYENGCVTAGFASIGSVVLDHTGHPAASITVTWRTSERVDAPGTRGADAGIRGDAVSGAVLPDAGVSNAPAPTADDRQPDDEHRRRIAAAVMATAAHVTARLGGP